MKRRARRVGRKVLAAARRGDKLACAILAEAAARSRTKTRRGRKRNPTLVTLHNPSTARSKLLADYKTFHGVEPPKVRDLGPRFPDMMALGDCLEVVYRPTRGQRRGPAFFHKFKRGTQLARDVAGTLYILRKDGKPVRFDPKLGITG